MKKHSAYALLSVLIVMAVVTTVELYSYQQYSQQRQIYTKLQNELLCQTMLNLKSEKISINKFNTGVVTLDDAKQAEVRLTNGFVYSVSQSTMGS